MTDSQEQAVVEETVKPVKKRAPRKPRAKKVEAELLPKEVMYVSEQDFVLTSGAQIATFKAGVPRQIPSGMVARAIELGIKEV